MFGVHIFKLSAENEGGGVSKGVLMQTLYVLYRQISFFDCPGEEMIIGVFADKNEALTAQAYASDNWSDTATLPHTGIISYVLQQRNVFTQLDEMTRWHDFPHRVFV